MAVSHSPSLLPSLRNMDSENKSNHHLRDWRENNTFRKSEVSVETTGWRLAEEVGDTGEFMWNRNYNHSKYIEWIHNKALLYSTGNYIQYPVINHNGK